MSLKTAWLNLQDGLGNRFAWSHVNAIYYSQAQNKLLKDKLDDMETAINGKVAKTDIVQVESTSQTTVPSSAYLKTVKDALDSDISELNSGTVINEGLTSDDVTIISGGYSIIGKIAIVNVRVQCVKTINSGYTIKISGFPRAKIPEINTIAVHTQIESLSGYCEFENPNIAIKLIAKETINISDPVIIISCVYVTN